MFVIMAVDTQIFPIAAVLGVVAMVAVLVVDGQQLQVFPLKLASALGANPAVNLEGLFAVICVVRAVARLETIYQTVNLFRRGQLAQLRATLLHLQAPWREKR